MAETEFAQLKLQFCILIGVVVLVILQDGIIHFLLLQMIPKFYHKNQWFHKSMCNNSTVMYGMFRLQRKINFNFMIVPLCHRIALSTSSSYFFLMFIFHMQILHVYITSNRTTYCNLK